MQVALSNASAPYGPIEALHFDTLLWDPVRRGRNICKMGQELLEAGNYASLALRRVVPAHAPQRGFTEPAAADPDLRARLVHLLDALPATSEFVHNLDKSSSSEEKWKAVAGLPLHYKGQLRLIDEVQWTLMDMKCNSNSATEQLSKLHPIG